MSQHHFATATASKDILPRQNKNLCYPWVYLMGHMWPGVFIN